MSVVLRQVVEDTPSRMDKDRQLCMDGQKDEEDWTKYLQLFDVAGLLCVVLNIGLLSWFQGLVSGHFLQY